MSALQGFIQFMQKGGCKQKVKKRGVQAGKNTHIFMRNTFSDCRSTSSAPMYTTHSKSASKEEEAKAEKKEEEESCR
jgi:hypothetical protein